MSFSSVSKSSSSSSSSSSAAAAKQAAEPATPENPSNNPPERRSSDTEKAAAAAVEKASVKAAAAAAAEPPALAHGERVGGSGNDPVANLQIAGFTKGTGVVLDEGSFGGALLFRCRKIKLGAGQEISKLPDLAGVPLLERTVVITRDRLIVVDCAVGIGGSANVKSSHHLVSELG